MKGIIKLTAITLILYSSSAMAQTTPTLVQQLQSYLAYELNELAEYGPPPGCGSNCYHFYRSARLTKQLATAQAAAAAGTPLPPIMNSKGVAPIWGPNGIAIGSGGSGVAGGAASRGTK